MRPRGSSFMKDLPPPPHARPCRTRVPSLLPSLFLALPRFCHSEKAAKETPLSTFPRIVRISIISHDIYPLLGHKSVILVRARNAVPVFVWLFFGPQSKC